MILTPGTMLGERYEIIEKIGAGGMSIVYKAKCNRLQRFVAVKMLREEFVKDEVFVNKFKVEALSAASLSHPNIVGVYDVGNDHDLHYIVMEYVEGQTLKELIAKESPLGSKMVLEYGLQMLGAIRHAHKKQIIHRDIKPQNILVTNDKVLKVTDFGIARAVDSSTLVATGNAIGSVHYFSPEQAKGKYVNATSDIYSCGIVLFELATKRLPFEADSHVSIALKHINEDLPRPSEYNPEISKGLEQIILKATNKKQELRYQSADEMIEDIKGVMSKPNYVVVPNIESEDMDSTVLLSTLETDMIRQSEKKEEAVPTSAPNPSPAKALAVEEIYTEDDDEEEEEVTPLYKFLVGAGGVLATLVILGIIAAAAIFFVPSLAKTDAVVVPKIEGQLLAEAEEMAKERGLKIKVLSEEVDDTVAIGTVLKQNPAAESTINKSGTIQVIVATKEDIVMVEVPNVEGMDNADAQRLLQKEDLQWKVDREFSEEIEVGQVISQTPAPGSEVKKGEIIKLVVSKGAEVVMTKVPNLLGLTLGDANVSIKDAKLTLGNVTEEYSDTIQINRIIDQNIRANNSVEQGTAIDIVISKGPKEEEPPVEEVPPVEEETPEQPPVEVPEEVPGSSEEESQEPVLATKQHTINLPAGSDKDEYHVVVIFQTDNGTQTLYEGFIRHDQFPMTIPITGSGSGQLITHFDGQVEYNDDYSF